MDRNSEQLQKSIDILSIQVCLFILIGSLIWGATLPKTVNPDIKVKQQLKILGLALWQIEMNQGLKSENLNASSMTKGRGPAQVFDQSGVVSKDPWGRPYSYLLKTDQQLLFVWSLGFDGKNESNTSLPLFQGDDIGQIIDIKMRY